VPETDDIHELLQVNWGSNLFLFKNNFFNVIFQTLKYAVMMKKKPEQINKSVVSQLSEVISKEMFKFYSKTNV
jgi:hypothetical protein